MPSSSCIGGGDSRGAGYFSTRRDHREGWLELTLGFDGGRVSVDSRLRGFDQLLDRALVAARANAVELSMATRRNLDWLGREDITEMEATGDA